MGLGTQSQETLWGLGLSPETIVGLYGTWDSVPETIVGLQSPVRHCVWLGYSTYIRTYSINIRHRPGYHPSPIRLGDLPRAPHALFAHIHTYSHHIRIIFASYSHTIRVTPAISPPTAGGRKAWGPRPLNGICANMGHIGRIRSIFI